MTRARGRFVRLSVDYLDDAAIAALDEHADAEQLFVRALAFCGRAMTDGEITGEQLRRLGLRYVDRRARKLVNVGLFEPTSDGFRVRNFLKWNESRDEIESAREGVRARQAAARARRHADVTSDVTRDSRVQKTETETETETEAAAAASALPPQIVELQARLVDARLVVEWDLSLTQIATVLEAIERCGVRALVDYAKARHRPDSPAFSAAAWVNGWARLPDRRRLRVTATAVAPCPHEDPRGANACGLCRRAASS